jgi:glutamine synthetase
MSTDSGDNLLDPTLKPETNYRFLLFLVAILDAVYKHGGLLRSGIASASNEHRLGANEAPPGIVSAFLGDVSFFYSIMVYYESLIEFL